MTQQLPAALSLRGEVRYREVRATRGRQWALYQLPVALTLCLCRAHVEEDKPHLAVQQHSQRVFLGSQDDVQALDQP